MVVEPTFALGFFNDLDQFDIFNNDRNEDTCLDFNPKKRYSDDDLKEYISSFVAINTLPELEFESRNKHLAEMKELTGASNRQLSRVLNMGRRILDRV